MFHHPKWTLSGGETEGNSMAVYSDSDWAGDQPYQSVSTTGVFVVVNGFPIHWKSKRQPSTSYSSTAAEIYAYSEGVRDAKRANSVLSEMGINLPFPLVVQVDNKGVKSFATGSCVESKLKGVWDLREEWVKELRDVGMVKPMKIPRSDNCADGFTRCLNAKEFRQFVSICKKQG